MQSELVNGLHWNGMEKGFRKRDNYELLEKLITLRQGPEDAQPVIPPAMTRPKGSIAD
jgi:hypothetical protein